MKRLIKKNAVETREYLIPTTPLYNPLGQGESTEFPDEKSYEKMFNQNTMKLIDERLKEKGEF